MHVTKFETQVELNKLNYIYLSFAWVVFDMCGKNGFYLWGRYSDGGAMSDGLGSPLRNF